MIVEITDQDYRDLFGDRSPLDPGTLIQLATAVQQYAPAVIGMDFDTEVFSVEKKDFSSFTKLLPGAATQSAGKLSPVVWAQVPCNIIEPLTLAPVLGGSLHDPHFFGIPRFPVDSDGMVRSYQSAFQATGKLEPCPTTFVHTTEESAAVPTSESGGELNVGSASSFARAVSDRACQDPAFDCSSRRPEENPVALWGVIRSQFRRICFGSTDCLSLFEDQAPSVIFNFYGDRYRFPIIQAHEFLGSDAQESNNDQSLQIQRRALLRDKIVLIGGSFHAARDVYNTPLGQMAGVELIALAIQSDFGGGIREAQKVFEILADILAGALVVLVYFYYQHRPRVAFYASLLGIFLATLLFSFILFRTAAYWFNFMPIVIGMIMHQMLELSKSCSELQHEVHVLEHKLQSMTRPQDGHRSAVERMPASPDDQSGKD